jgi:hypothetical protein
MNIKISFKNTKNKSQKLNVKNQNQNSKIQLKESYE